MSELLNYPFINQLASPTHDGHADENAAMNCVPSCIASGLDYLLHGNYSPDDLKDACYGEGYIGATAAVGYVTFCAKLGVRLSPINGNTTYLVQQIHAQLSQSHPVIGTIPSSYNPPADPMNPGESHCIAFYKDEPGVLVAMNPWNAFAHVGSDAYWIARLCFGQVWTMQKVSTTTVNIPQGWKDSNNILVAPNGKNVQHGFRQYVLAHEWHPDDYPLTGEMGVAGGETTQLFRSRRLIWTAPAGVTERYLGDELLAVPTPSIDLKPIQAALTQTLNEINKVIK
jgi:hypothetical protein